MLNWIMWETLWWLPTVLRTEVREITTSSASYAETLRWPLPASSLGPSHPPSPLSLWATAQWLLCLKHSILYSHVTLKFLFKFYHHEASLDHLI